MKSRKWLSTRSQIASNPEVCDPCGPNCVSTYLDYFDNAGNYITTSQTPPYNVTFAYNFYINGIVKPDYGMEADGSCPKTSRILPAITDRESRPMLHRLWLA